MDFLWKKAAFWVTINVHKEEERITLSLPAINFETGPYAEADIIPALFKELIPDLFISEGGTLRTVDGFLPKNCRPADPLYRSYVVPSNNGQSVPVQSFFPNQGKASLRMLTCLNFRLFIE